MKRGKLTRAMDYLDEDLIAEAVEVKAVEKENGRKLEKKRDRTPRGGMWKRVAAVAAAAVFLVTGGVVLSQFVGVDEGSSIIALDVNPSMEMEVNDKERVVSVEALNQDAENVLQALRLENEDLDSAVNAIIESMVEKGYLTADKNSILISVNSANGERANSLRTSVSDKVSHCLEDRKIGASVITQRFERNEDIKDYAEKNGISEAKATLIKRIIDAKMVDSYGIPYTYEELVGLNVNELKQMIESKTIRVDGIHSVGVAGKGDFISEAEAFEIAYTAASVPLDTIVEWDVELDFDKHSHTMSYEVEFETAESEYEYMINAVTGHIIEWESEWGDEDNPMPALPEGCIEKAEALAIVYAHANVAADAVIEVEFEVKSWRGMVIYRIEFETESCDYEYTLEGTGRILYDYAERENDWQEGNHDGHKPEMPVEPEPPSQPEMPVEPEPPAQPEMPLEPAA